MATKPLTPFLETLIRSTRSPRSAYICNSCIRHQQLRTKTTKAAIVPKPTPFVPDVQTFLTLIGRGLSAQASKFKSWNDLFTLTSEELREAGIEPARTRRYLLRWREKFRKGEYGVGGDLQHVKDGAAELRVCEVPSLKEDNTFVSATVTPGFTKLILNVPSGKEEHNLQQGVKTAGLKKPRDYKIVHGSTIAGPYAIPVKGSNGSVAVVKVQEGMWEDRRGQKVFGGERRRAEVLHKMGVAAHRKAMGTAR